MLDVDRPLLFLKLPTLVPRRAIRGGPAKINFPPHKTQTKRLDPQFRALTEYLLRKETEISDSAVGIYPEQVLVLETVGSIQDFVKAVNQIQGMDWLVGLDQIEIAPDEDFNFVDQENSRLLPGQLFLILSNNQAMTQLLSLWNRYKRNPHDRFPPRLAKWKHVFNQLKTIRHWDVDDRLRETGVTEDWAERLKQGTDIVRVEIEAWFKGTAEQRVRSAVEIEKRVLEEGGKIIHSTIIAEIDYHGILCELPITAIAQFLLDKSSKLLRCDDVMFFRPTGQAVLPKEADLHEVAPPLVEETSADYWIGSGQPIVALLDGLPIANHVALEGRLVVDDPENWASDYPAKERKHGTAMASIIANGDLGIQQPPLQRRIYVRPILKPDTSDFVTPRREGMPSNFLTVDLVYRAVSRMFTATPGQAPAAPMVKVINFSVGDYYQPFYRFISPIARLIDFLSWRFNVLFVVSAGNQPQPIELNIKPNEFDKLGPTEQQDLVLQHLTDDSRNRRILSPAESINALTVGATHTDHSTIPTLGDRMNLLIHDYLLSPISPSGYGFRKSLKPEIHMPGGRQLYIRKLTAGSTKTVFEVSNRIAVPPGIKTAYPGLSGELSKTVYTAGTSNATALTTRTAGQLLEMIQELQDEFPENPIEDEHITSLVKALLIHGADWGGAEFHLEPTLGIAQGIKYRRAIVRKELSRLLGYGPVSPEKLFDCTDDRATLLGTGTISSDEGNKFVLPIPECLNGSSGKRRLTITLAWISPVNFSHQKYRRAHLWFDSVPKELELSRSQADFHAVRRGTAQHEIFEGSDLISFQKGNNIEVWVSCRSEVGNLDIPIPYSLVVSLQVADLPIYEEIRSLVSIPFPIRPRR